MHIITTMNFRGKNETIMCKAWIHFAKRFNPDATITIIHHFPLLEIKRFAAHFKKIQFIQLTKNEMKPEMVHGHTDHPCQEIKLAVWKQAKKHNIQKFLYIDCDAFIFHSLQSWWDHIDDKPFIAINEQVAPYDPIFNAGVFSYSSSDDFITYEKLLGQYKADNNRIKLHLGDQGLINTYLREMNYDYTHPAIDFTYNCIAKWSKTLTISDSSVKILSGTFPFLKKVLIYIKGRELDWWEKWAWWGQNKQVKILHAFGRKGFKFWDLPECQLLWEYCKKISQSTRPYTSL